MNQVNVALAASGPDQSSFLYRATQRADKGYAAQFANGSDIIKLLIGFSKNAVISRIDIFGHGWECGVRGKKGYWNGLFVNDSKPIADNDESYLTTTPCVIKLGLGGTYVKTLADAIKAEKILVRAFGEISFWSCDGFEVAQNLSKELSAGIPVQDWVLGNDGKTKLPVANRWFNRSDIIVVGSKGSVVPVIGGSLEKGAKAVKSICTGGACIQSPDANFYFLQDGSVQTRKNPRLFTDLTPEFKVPVSFFLGLPFAHHEWMVGPQFDRLAAHRKQLAK